MAVLVSFGEQPPPPNLDAAPFVSLSSYKDTDPTGLGPPTP